jgi:ABC-type multidrug transport system ATPase subunit
VGLLPKSKEWFILECQSTETVKPLSIYFNYQTIQLYNYNYVSMNKKIYIENLSKSFGKQEALKNISLSFENQSVVAVVGHNGSGKTTLMKCLLGLVIPDKGEILVNGKKITETGEYRNDIGYMPQISRYPDYLKISQLFEMMTDIRKSQMLSVRTQTTAELLVKTPLLSGRKKGLVLRYENKQRTLENR